jgi:hypothetical protein
MRSLPVENYYQYPFEDRIRSVPLKVKSVSCKVEEPVLSNPMKLRLTRGMSPIASSNLLLQNAFMKNQSAKNFISSTTNTNNQVSIHQLVNKLQANLLPYAVKKRSFIINDVEEDLCVAADENVLSFIVGGLLSNTIFGRPGSCIRIEAVTNEQGVQLKIRSNGSFAYSSTMYSLGNIMDAARQVGGNIGLISESNSGMAIVFSMTNNKAA